MFAGVGERTREGNDLLREMVESKVIKYGDAFNEHMEKTGEFDLTKVDKDEIAGSKVSLVYGQMTEPPGARLRVALSGLTVAEYFRDQGNDVLFFVDNIFRFTQAGSEVSALLGRMPSAVGYQPTLAIGNGRDAGTHHFDQDRCYHVDPGRLRSGRRLHRSGSGDDVCSPRCCYGFVASDR